MPAILLLLSGLSLFKFSKQGVGSLENLYQDDFDLDGPIDWNDWGSGDPVVDPNSNGAIEDKTSFIDNLSIKEFAYPLAFLSVILFSKPWK